MNDIQDTQMHVRSRDWSLYYGPFLFFLGGSMLENAKISRVQSIMIGQGSNMTSIFSRFSVSQTFIKTVANSLLRQEKGYP